MKSQKLIKVSLEYDDLNNTIHSIKISGDFFLYPEESIDKLEKNLIGIRLEKNSIKQIIQQCLQNSEIFGFDSESMTEAIFGCLIK
ncbi:MAG: lipoate--protein ligase family protein [Thaumarchaeota archaeon]|nr:lipoate--protein ligase family protein [Nitrososphaerota archaeon]